MPDAESLQLNRLERFGVRVLTHQSDQWPEPGDPIDVLTPKEQQALRSIHLAAVVQAGLAGALSAAASCAAALSAPLEQGAVRHWAVVGGVSLVATTLEFGFLYWDGLSKVRAMARAAGLRVRAESELDALVAVALARAALELPSPPHNWLGVDPHRDTSKWLLVLFSLLYKGKVVLTNVLLRAAIRRFLGPLATRALLLWLAVPVTALWNAVVAHQVLGQARLRVMGPSAAVDLVRWVLGSDAEGELADLPLRAIGGSIVANRDAHPNVLIFARALSAEGSAGASVDLGNRDEFLRLLAAAPARVQKQALRATIATAVLDGRITRRELKWLERVFACAEQPLPRAEVRRLRDWFIAGKGVASLLARDPLF